MELETKPFSIYHALLLFAILVWGCNGGGGTTTTSSTTSSTTGGSTDTGSNTGGGGSTTTPISKTVPATSSWVDSGVTLSGGETVCITATASWKPDPQQPAVGPDGRSEPCDPANNSCPLHANHGALLGKVGSNQAFFIGDSFKFVNSGSGNLQLMINDATTLLSDNTGSATASIQVGNCSVTILSASGFTLAATTAWTNSGITLSGGETVCITATASWKPDPQQPAVGAMGRSEPCDPANTNCPIQANHGALVGKVGSNTVFYIGENFRFLNASSGTLQLMINDATNLLSDNSGSATVQVQTSGC